MNILNEYIAFKEKEAALGFTLPTPVYLFIEHYGREPVSDLSQLAEAFGVRNSFRFSTEELSADSKLYQSFFNKLQKNAPMGQEFEGCILISLSEQMGEADFCALVSLLKASDRIVPVFTQKSDAATKKLQRILKNNFFLRIVEGEAYRTEELFAVARDELTRCGLVLTEEASHTLFQTLEDITWAKSDMVCHRLKTLIQNLAYDKLLYHSDYTLSPEDITTSFAKEFDTQKSFPIGFAGK